MESVGWITNFRTQTLNALSKNLQQRRRLNWMIASTGTFSKVIYWANAVRFANSVTHAWEWILKNNLVHVLIRFSGKRPAKVILFCCLCVSAVFQCFENKTINCKKHRLQYGYRFTLTSILDKKKLPTDFMFQTGVFRYI